MDGGYGYRITPLQHIFSHQTVVIRAMRRQSQPTCSMYVVFINIYHVKDPNVGTYTIHGDSQCHAWCWNIY